MSEQVSALAELSHSVVRVRPTRRVSLTVIGIMAGTCASRALMLGIQIAYVRLYTRALSTPELGYYYFLASAAAILNAVLFLPFDEFQQARSMSLVERGQALGSLVQVNLRILAWCAGLTAVAECVLRVTGFHPGSALLLMALSVATYSATALRRLLNNLRHWRTAQTLFLIEPVLKCIAFAVWVRGAHSTGVGLTVTTTIGLLGVTLASTVMLARRGLLRRSEDEKIALAPLFHQIWPMSYGSLLNLIQTYGYRLILVPFGYAELVGVYATVTQLGQAGMVSIANVFRQIFDPKLYSTRGRYLKTYLQLAAAVSLACLVGAILLSRVLIPLCTKPEFAPYAAIVGYGIFAEVASLISGALFTYLTIVGRTASLRKASTCGFVCFVSAFACLAATHSISVYTMGIPMIISYGVATGALIIQSTNIKAGHGTKER